MDFYITGMRRLRTTSDLCRASTSPDHELLKSMVFINTMLQSAITFGTKKTRSASLTQCCYDYEQVLATTYHRTDTTATAWWGLVRSTIILLLRCQCSPPGRYNFDTCFIEGRSSGVCPRSRNHASYDFRMTTGVLLNFV